MTSIPGPISRIYVHAGVPVDAGSGTFAKVAPKGALLVDSTNGNLYQNTNTTASPTWVARSSTELTSLLANIPTTAVTSVTATDATSAANSSYTQADQTALADLANSTKAQLNDLLAKLRTAGIVST